MTKTSLYKLSNHPTLKLTELRQVILDIFIQAKKPLSAYEVLNTLKRKRPNAEPPTVYRVIDYFVQKKLVHRIETGNKYVCCSQLNNFESKYHGIIFLCQKCNLSFELLDEKCLSFIKYFSKKYAVSVDESLIEIKGTCRECLKDKGIIT